MSGELLAERGIQVDHVTLYRWAQRFTPLLIDATRPCQHATGDRWFVDETYCDRGQHRPGAGLPQVHDELVPSACPVVQHYANNPIEADHGRFKARPRPKRELNGSAR